MNIQAVLFMCNDFARAKFTLENFSRWNPEILITIINSGGECPKPYLSHIKNTQFIDAPNMWHKKTHCGKGSFDFRFFQYFFNAGTNESYSHTLLLETDVLTNRKITKTPLYDISGITKFGGDENIYKYLNLNTNRLHSGCGGTIFSRGYFSKIIKKLFLSLQLLYINSYVILITLSGPPPHLASLIHLTLIISDNLVPKLTSFLVFQVTLYFFS